MSGIDHILSTNGFAMAAVGVSIVFTSLVALSLVISQLHRLLVVWDNRKMYIEKARNRIVHHDRGKTEPVSIDFEQIHKPARQFHLLVQHIKEPFALPKLIHTAETVGIRHAHRKVSRLIFSNLIVPDQRGFFRWNHDLYKEMEKRED